jgi:antitoxin PrlF
VQDRKGVERMMKKGKRRTRTCEEAATCATPCCKIEALVSLDARGQILIPKEIREKAGWKPGVKLVVISYESDGKISRIALAQAEEFAQTAREMLGPMMGLLED